MAFRTKHDFFGLTSTAGVVITESNENKTASAAEGRDERGDIVALQVFGETMSPQCSYVLSADASLASMKCGTVIAGTGDYAGQKFTLGNVTINTSAGSPPTIQASGEEIPSTSTTSDCTYTFPAATLKACHHAQLLWGAATIGGDGCYLQQANYTAGGTISRATKNGETVAYDVVDGKLEASLTIIQTGDTAPTVTAGTDWVLVAPLTLSNPDSDYGSWTCSLARYLTHDTQSNS